MRYNYHAILLAIRIPVGETLRNALIRNDYRSSREEPEAINLCKLQYEGGVLQSPGDTFENCAEMGIYPSHGLFRANCHDKPPAALQIALPPTERLKSGVNFSGSCKKQPENEISAAFFAAVDEILKYSHSIINRFEPVAQK